MFVGQRCHGCGPREHLASVDLLAETSRDLQEVARHPGGHAEDVALALREQVRLGVQAIAPVKRDGLVDREVDLPVVYVQKVNMSNKKYIQYVMLNLGGTSGTAAEPLAFAAAFSRRGLRHHLHDLKKREAPEKQHATYNITKNKKFKAGTHLHGAFRCCWCLRGAAQRSIQRGP